MRSVWSVMRAARWASASRWSTSAASMKRRNSPRADATASGVGCPVRSDRALATISQSCDTCALIDAVVVVSFVGSPSRRTTTEKRGAGMLKPGAEGGA